MRVMHLVKTVDGADWAWKMAAQLVNLGVEVHAVLPRLSGRFVADWQASGAKLHAFDASLPVRRPWEQPARARAFRALVASIAPDLLHAHFVTNAVFARLALGDAGPQRIFQVAGPLHLEHPLFRAGEAACAGRRDWWVASSRFVRDNYLRRGVSPDRVFLSYYGSDPATFQREPTGALRRALDLPPRAFVVGNINWFYPPKRYLGHTRGLKNHEDVLEAARMLAHADGLRWVLVGRQWGESQRYYERLRRRAADSGAPISLPGWRSAAEVRQWWADFDLAVHVPLSENCGGVIEPLMAGVPVVAAAVGGLPEVIIPGLTGELVPQRDPAALARAVLRARSDPEAARSRARLGQRLVREMFDVSRTAREIHGIYEHVLGVRRERPEEFDSRRMVRSWMR